MVHHYRARSGSALLLGAGLCLTAFLAATVAPRAAHADYSTVGGTTYIYSGHAGLTGALAGNLVSGTGSAGTYYAGVTDSTTTFAYGHYDTGTHAFNALTTGGPLAASGTVANVQKVDSYSTAGGPFYWADPVAGSSWVSAYVEGNTAAGTGTGEGSFYGEAARIPNNNGGTALLDTFKYTTTFTLDPSYSGNQFALSGTMLTDDMCTGIWLDYGTANAQQLTFTQGTGDSITYRFEAPFGGGVGSAPPLTHTLSFFVLDNGNDRTGISFMTSAAVVPEPGAIATATMMAGAVLGCVVRARRRRNAGDGMTA